MYTSKERSIAVKRVSKYARREVPADEGALYKKSVLTDRDKGVLLSLYYHRCLTTSQIAEMHYSGAEAGNTQSLIIARRRLRKMFDYALVDRFYVDTMVNGASESHYVLDSRGAALVAGMLNIPLKELCWQYRMNEVKLPFLKHMVQINMFYLYIKRYGDSNGYSVEGYRTESHCRHDFKFWGTKMACNPDAYGQIWHGDDGVHFFLEMDNGTMSIPVFIQKHKRYTAFYASGEYRAAYDTFPLILVVAPTLQRAEALRRAIYELDNTDLCWMFNSIDTVASTPFQGWLGRDKGPICLF